MTLPFLRKNANGYTVRFCKKLYPLPIFQQMGKGEVSLSGPYVYISLPHSSLEDCHEYLNEALSLGMNLRAGQPNDK